MNTNGEVAVSRPTLDQPKDIAVPTNLFINYNISLKNNIGQPNPPEQRHSKKKRTYTANSG
jgi:hypothetical protein